MLYVILAAFSENTKQEQRLFPGFTSASTAKKKTHPALLSFLLK